MLGLKLIHVSTRGPLALGRFYKAECSIFKCSDLTYAQHKSPSHYNDVTMGAMASQITSLTIVYSTVYSGADQRKHQKLCVTGLCAGNSPGTDEFPAQIASYAENVSIWWRHHVNGHHFIRVSGPSPVIEWINILVKTRWIIQANISIVQQRK